MKIVVFSAKSYDRRFLDAANSRHRHELLYLDAQLTRQTAELARGHAAVCAFVNDRLDAAGFEVLARAGVRLVLLRCAGYNHVDLAAANEHDIAVSNVPGYSPYAVAEHTIALMLALNRHIPRAYMRVKEGNLSIEGLLGFDMNGKTASLVGVGKIGAIVGKILQGFGCRVCAYDPHPSPAAIDADFIFASLEETLAAADIVSLHCPLVPGTRHVINRHTLGWMKRGAMLINTSRGALIDTGAVLDALDTGRLGALGLDVYEDEAGIFYEDHSHNGFGDDLFSRVIAHPNALVTGHQGFFTQEALTTIAETTLAAAADFQAGRPLAHALPAQPATSVAPVRYASRSPYAR